MPTSRTPPPGSTTVHFANGDAHFQTPFQSESLTGPFDEREIINFVLSNCLREADVVLDIGANVGLWAIPVAKSVHKGRVYCFEPEELTLGELEQNLSLNKLDNVCLLDYAVSAACGQAAFYVREDSELNSLFEFSPLTEDGYREKTVVKTTTIDELVSRKVVELPDFMKIDVEGAELMVLDGISKGFANHLRNILIEVHASCLTLQGINDAYNALKMRLDRLGLDRVIYLDEMHILATKSQG